MPFEILGASIDYVPVNMTAVAGKNQNLLVNNDPVKG
jgi:hypothetical protein